MKEYAMMSREEKWTCLEQETLTPELLREMANDADDEVRLALAEHLCGEHTSVSEQLLLQLMDDFSMQVRTAACDSIYWSSSERVLIKLVEKSVSDSYLVRGYAVLSAGDVLLNMDVQRQEYGFAKLRKNHLQEKSIWVRICYAQSLYRLGDMDALYKLMSYLNVSRYHHRCCAVNLLMDIADESNYESILQAFKKRRKMESNRMLCKKLDECISQLQASADPANIDKL